MFWVNGRQAKANLNKTNHYQTQAASKPLAALDRAAQLSLFNKYIQMRCNQPNQDKGVPKEFQNLLFLLKDFFVPKPI